MGKKFCQCGKRHSTPSASIKCKRAREPDYGFKNLTQVEQKKPVIAIEAGPQMIQLRNRQVEKVQLQASVIQNGRKTYEKQTRERQQIFKNVLWSNSLKIIQRINSDSQKKVKCQALKILLSTRQSLWFTICMYIQKKECLKYMPQIPQQASQEWEKFYLKTQNAKIYLRNQPIRQLLRNYYQYCQEDLILGQPSTFTEEFSILKDYILPLTANYYKVHLKEQYEFYFALQGSQGDQLISIMRYLKKTGLRKLLKSQPDFKQDQTSRDAGRKLIARLATTAYYYFDGASNIRQIYLYRDIFDWMFRLVMAYHEKREKKYQECRLNKKIMQYIRQEQEGQDSDKRQIAIPQKTPKPKIQYKKGSRSWLFKASGFYETIEQRKLRYDEEMENALAQKQRLKDQRKKKRARRFYHAAKEIEQIKLMDDIIQQEGYYVPKTHKLMKGNHQFNRRYLFKGKRPPIVLK